MTKTSWPRFAKGKPFKKIKLPIEMQYDIKTAYNMCRFNRIVYAEKDWDDGVNKAVDKFYGSKYDEGKTNACHKFVNAIIPNGEERVKKVIQTLY